MLLRAVGQVEVQPASPARRCAPTEVLLGTLRLGICGSDRHVLHGRHPFVRPPVRTGHEAVARVLGTGPAVSGLAEGDLVVVNPLISCGRCERCRAKAINHCERAKVLGFALPGLATDQVVLEARSCHRVPDGLPSRSAVLAEPLAVGWHAVGRATRLTTTLVIGAGPVGLAVVLALRARGAERITVVEPVAAKRALALELGADTAVPPDAAAAMDRVATSFDCVADAATLRLAGSVTEPGGVLVVVGVPAGDVSLPMARLQRWEIDVRGTGLYLGADIDAALAALAIDDRPAARLVTAEYPVAEAASAFAAADRPDQVKVLINWPDAS